MCGGREIGELSVHSIQFGCDSKTVLKNKKFINNKKTMFSPLLST